MKNKKIIYLMGGLGNVMFQLNYAHHLRAQGLWVEINHTLLNESFLTSKVFKWSNHGTFDILNSINLLDDFICHSRGAAFTIPAAISKSIGRDFLSTCFYGIESPVTNEIKSRHLFGYFHMNNPINEIFVEKIKFALSMRMKKSDFINFENILCKIGDNFVVHVRGGDYKIDPNFKPDLTYYKSALLGQKKCFIVTNDVDFSKNLFKNISIDYSFIETQNVIDDFIVLAMCRKKILANSTFSWWAAELGSSDSVILQKDPFFAHIKAWRPDTRLPRKFVSTL
jgi:hypothetical protein